MSQLNKLVIFEKENFYWGLSKLYDVEPTPWKVRINEDFKATTSIILNAIVSLMGSKKDIKRSNRNLKQQLRDPS